MWAKDEFDTLLEELPVLKELSLQLISRSGHNNRQRLFTALSASPEEKYDSFVQQYPELLSRLPLHMIAAYLGISLKTLTRIRHSRLPR
jgi:ribosomal protein L10